MFTSLAIAVSWMIQRHAHRLGTQQPDVQTVQFPGAGSSAFDLRRRSFPLAKSAPGASERRDPRLSNPRFTTAAEASYLNENDRVIGVVSGDESRAYPLAILNHHEVINDRIGELPVVVTYCPLYDSASRVSYPDRKTDW